METSKITNWLQIIANLGIVGGLILVGIQINQNTEMAQADQRARVYEQVIQYQIAMMGENPSKAVATASANPSELTDEELLVLRRIFGFWTNLDSLTEHNRDQGFIRDSVNIESVWKDRARTVYGANPVWAAMWEDEKNSGMEWKRIVDEEIKLLKHDYNEKQLQRWREAIQVEQ